MSVEKKTIAPALSQRIIRIQNLTVIWMSLEAAVALGAAWMARSLHAVACERKTAALNDDGQCSSKGRCG